jgi:hypothetical protein
MGTRDNERPNPVGRPLASQHDLAGATPCKGDGTDPAELRPGFLPIKSSPKLVFASFWTPTQRVIASRPMPCVNFRTDRLSGISHLREKPMAPSISSIEMAPTPQFSIAVLNRVSTWLGEQDPIQLQMTIKSLRIISSNHDIKVVLTRSKSIVLPDLFANCTPSK